MKMFNPAHPGRILRASFNDECTVADAARKMGVAEQTLLDIMACQAPITPEIAALLPTVFPWDTPEMWLTMQRDYDEWQANHPTLIQAPIPKAAVTYPAAVANSSNISFA